VDIVLTDQGKASNRYTMMFQV